VSKTVSAVATALACALVFAAAALGDTQPSQVGNAADRNGGASAPGPHCHFVLPASGHHFDLIITGTIHQAHTETGLPTGIFQATACPAP